MLSFASNSGETTSEMQEGKPEFTVLIPKTILVYSKVCKEMQEKAKQSIVSSIFTDSSVFSCAISPPRQLSARNTNNSCKHKHKWFYVFLIINLHVIMVCVFLVPINPVYL